MIKNTNQSSQKNPFVVWAIDPFDKKTSPDLTLTSQMNEWSKQQCNVDIQPIYIITSSQTEADLVHSEQYLRDLGITKARPVVILVAKTNDRRDQVNALLEFADRFQTSCIIVSSHGRSGIDRMIFGSFAEALLEKSKYPLLFLTHTQDSEKHTNKINRVLFATDFSKTSWHAFRHFVTEAKHFHFELTIFYSVCLSPSVISDGSGIGVSLPEDYFPNQVAWAIEEGNKWIKHANDQEVSSKLAIKDDGISSQIAQSILNTASDEKAGLIVMASSSGAVHTLLMGSVAHEVFRSNQFPVWVYGPSSLKGTRESLAKHAHSFNL